MCSRDNIYFHVSTDKLKTVLGSFYPIRTYKCEFAQDREKKNFCLALVVNGIEGFTKARDIIGNHTTLLVCP